MAYSSTEDEALLMHALGPGAQLAKIDIREAYRMVPLCPSERPFLAVARRGEVYVDCQLPFGLASVPVMFSAEALEWILRQRGVRGVLHYLDDFLFLGAPNTSECARALTITIATCAELGVPLAQEKIEGPSMSLTFLGIRLYSTPLLLSLLQGKVGSLRVMLHRIVDSRSVHDAFALESQVGHLVHATKVCPLGKAFLSGLFQVLRGMQVPCAVAVLFVHFGIKDRPIPAGLPSTVRCHRLRPLPRCSPTGLLLSEGRCRRAFIHSAKWAPIASVRIRAEGARGLDRHRPDRYQFQ